MAEGRALHYLLTGRAPTADEGGGGAGAGAMMQLGLAGANRLTGGVMSKLGIEDFEMSSRQLADGQEVHLGGYLTPQLYLRYGVSTFDKVYTFRLRYRLRPQFFVEAISGIENAIDFLYSFER
jgi:translocation and assembly module TamB